MTVFLAREEPHESLLKRQDSQNEQFVLGLPNLGKSIYNELPNVTSALKSCVQLDSP